MLILVGFGKIPAWIPIIVITREFVVSVISEKADFELFKHFGFQSGRDVDKFADYGDYETASNGIPYITKGINAYISAEVEQTVDVGTHYLFIAKVTDMEVLNETPSASFIPNSVKGAISLPCPIKPLLSTSVLSGSP